MTFLRDENGPPAGILGISRDITKRKRQEDALRESKDTIEALLNGTTDHALLLDVDANFLALNEAAARRLGKRVSELIGKKAPDYLPPGVRENRTSWFDKAVRTGEGVRFQDECAGRYFDNTVYPILDDSGKVKAVAIFDRDITEHKIADEQLRASLKQNEVLLREVHHRVKNNLQVVSSLLNLQSRNMKEKTCEQVFSESRSRIQSMALIHEKLYKASDLAHIDFKEYITSLLGDLFYSFGANANRIAIKLDIEAAPLTVDTATPCALITNELVSNCLKHAFPDSGSGMIRIGFAAGEEEFELVVSDNGVGLPEDIDPQHPRTLGLRLVNTLVKQLGGRMEVRRTDGAEFRIRFKRSASEALREEISNRSGEIFL
jgi:PAS domain S-box-containing protein